MTLSERIAAVVQLGLSLTGNREVLESAINKSFHQNQWFVKENIHKALDSICTQYLAEEKLNTWLSKYSLSNIEKAKSIGLVLAGNIPLVGFHDVLTVFIAGHHCAIKLSDKDKELIPALIRQLGLIHADCLDYFSFVDRLEDYDAVIATGSNSTAVHFEYYFKHVPHIIRRNRNAIAILDGAESRDDILALGQDIFSFFGLGCRNVSKLYLPREYNTDFLMEALHDFKELALHNKYKNNFDYNYAIYLLNQDKFLMNGCVLLKESEDIASRIGMVGFEYYDDISHLKSLIQPRMDEIQLIASNKAIPDINTLRFGEAQNPQLWDYADGVDTLQFLLDL